MGLWFSSGRSLAMNSTIIQVPLGLRVERPSRTSRNFVIPQLIEEYGRSGRSRRGIYDRWYQAELGVSETLDTQHRDIVDRALRRGPLFDRLHE